MLPDNYSLTLVTPPEAEPVTLEFVKAACRIQSTSEDDLITFYISSAREQVEMDADLKLMPQTWLYKFDGASAVDVIQLPVTPVLSITSVKYLDTNHQQQTLNPTHYYAELDSLPPRILTAPGYAWPATSDKAGAWEVEIEAGFEDADAVPFRARQAICLLVGHWYQNRELASDRNTKAVGMSYDRIVTGLRRGFV